MRRTAGRPMPSGLHDGEPRAVVRNRAGAWRASRNWRLGESADGILGAITLGGYLFVYTPMKQRSHLSTVVGALPGAMPPLMGYAASYGALNREAWRLFVILFVWQFPHFLAIAWMYRDDYARAGIRMLPVVEPDGKSTRGKSFFMPRR